MQGLIFFVFRAQQEDWAIFEPELQWAKNTKVCKLSFIITKTEIEELIKAKELKIIKEIIRPRENSRVKSILFNLIKRIHFS